MSTGMNRRTGRAFDNDAASTQSVTEATNAA